MPQPTFLFTDLEGSTRRWELFPDEMRACLARHDERIRQAIVQAGGQVFKTVGDAFYATFPGIPEAAAAAVAAHRALASESWGVLGELRVRVAIHRGPVEARGGDFYGACLNRLARILAAGHGGQTLLSATATEALRANLPADWSLKELGVHRLKDLVEPETIFQLEAPGLRASFPALNTLERVQPRLPLPPTRLLGREELLEQTAALLRSNEVRVLTLLGPGGAGKTRLGLELAGRLASGFRSGAVFVPLADVEAPAQVVSAIAGACGLEESAGKDPLEELCRWVRGRQPLLLVDNFEHVLAAAPVLSRLSASEPALRILVTSRAALHLYGGRDVLVPPLELGSPSDAAIAPAVQLFLDRAAAQRPGLKYDAPALEAVREICRRLDGMPLAIELAAARARLLDPPALLARLSSTIGASSLAPRDAPERHRSLHAAADWSYRLLDHDGQRLFRRLAICVGGFDLPAAEALAEADPPCRRAALDTLALLVDSSLAQPVAGSEPPRFSMLETLRQFGAGRLAEAGELASARAAHALHFFGLMAGAEPLLASREQVACLNRLERELPNLRAALDGALDRGEELPALDALAASARFFEIRGHLRETAERLTRLLGRAPAGREAIQHGRGLAVASRFQWKMGAPVLAAALAERAVAVLERLGADEDLAYALHQLGSICGSLGLPARGSELWGRGLVLCRKLGRPVPLARSAHAFASSEAAAGRPDHARALYSEALELCRQTGDAWWGGAVCVNLGSLEISCGRLGEARAWAARAIDCLTEVGSHQFLSAAVLLAAGVAAHQGEAARAARLIAAARTQASSVGAVLDGDDAAALLSYEQLARRELDEAAWELETRAGSALSLDEALELAREG